MSVTFDRWVDEHGPLSTQAAVLLALDMCAHASRLSAAEIRTRLESLRPARVTRTAEGGWAWMPEQGAAATQPIKEFDVVERIGAIFFLGLCGQPAGDRFEGDRERQARLRRLRPDLPPQLADIAVRATAATRRHLRLHEFAHQLRDAVGPAVDDRRWSRRYMGWVAGAATIAVLLFVWRERAMASADQPETHGLTSRETELFDVVSEAAQAFAVTGEHTAAVQQYQQLLQLLRLRLGPDDPRVAWNLAHEAWVRSLAGDRLTTEQLLSYATWISGPLGDSHPYTRAIRLQLASTLEARAAKDEAGRLRAQAAGALSTLLGEDEIDSFSDPSIAGTIAHVSSSAPEREGFRRTGDRGFTIPLTSIQRLSAERDGWRLSIAAAGSCRVSFDIGNVPRRLTVAATRGQRDEWEFQIEGAVPPLTMHGRATGMARLTLVGSRTGEVVASFGTAHRSSSLDLARPVAVPPYSFSFSDGSPGACALAWLDIPMSGF